MEETTIISGRYAVGKRVGKGSFGQIHIGTQLDTNLQVAIKMV